MTTGGGERLGTGLSSIPMSTVENTKVHSNTPAHSKTVQRSWMWLSVVLASLLGVGLFVGTAGAILYDGISKQVDASVLDTSHLRPTAMSSGQPVEQNTDAFAGRAVNILLMGIDSRTEQDEAIVDAADDDPTMRSDTTLIMHLSADRQYVDIISIPRDQWLYLPECTRTDGSVSLPQWGQFNWAFSYGALTDDMAAGVTCTENTVEQITGLEMDGFAVIDFTGFYRMIQALGGVNICLDEPIDDPRYIDLVLPAGCQKLNAYDATKLARVRYTGDGSDMGRIERQQLLLGAMVQEAMNQNYLTDMPALYGFMSTALDATRLSPSLSNLRVDAGLVSSLKNTPPENIRFMTMPVMTADFDANRLMPLEPLNGELWQSIYDGTPLPAGIVYMDMNGDMFTINNEGVAEPGGERRTDNIVGTFDFSTNDGAWGGHSRRNPSNQNSGSEQWSQDGSN